MKSVLNLIVLLFFTLALQAQVGIGTTTPEATLDIVSTNDGLLIPRVALTSTSDITTVAPLIESKLVYNTTPASGTTDVSPGFYYLSSPTGPWVRLGEGSSGPPPPPPPPSATGWLLTGNAATAGDFLGTTNAVDLIFKRNDVESGKISTNLTSLGIEAGSNNTSGNQNTAIGAEALRDNSSAGSNTAIGFGALRNKTSGINNTAVGINAAATDISGSGNTAIGDGALDVLNGGDNNTALGFESGNSAQGSNNITIGYQAEVANGVIDNQVQMGNSAITFAGIQVAWTASSDRRFKETIKDSGLGLDFLQTIRPVSYIRKNDQRKRTEYGFIAQELEEALNNAGSVNNGIISISDKGMYGVRYNDLIPVTIKAVQEQQVLIEKLQKDNEELKATNAAILKRLEALENK